VPPQDWVEPYAALAEELGLPALTLQEAYDYVADTWTEWGLPIAGAPDTGEDAE
jgi:hypothetical protein